MRKVVMFVAALAAFGMVGCDKKMQTTESGLSYRIFESSDTARLVTKGDVLLLQMYGYGVVADSLGGQDTTLFDTKIGGKAFYIPSDEPTFKDVFMMFHKGDSAEFTVNADTLFMKSFGQPSPAFLAKNSNLHFFVRVENVYNQEEVMAEREASQKKAIMEDSVAAQKFLATLGNYNTTKSGLKYLVTKKGNGPMPKAGQEVKVLYKGTLLNGTVFDQNQDIQNPLKFVIGMRQVIPGWDEGIMLLHEGDEATFVIPSELAYGQQGGGPIPPSSTLVFDVKLLKVGNAPITKNVPNK